MDIHSNDRNVEFDYHLFEVWVKSVFFLVILLAIFIYDILYESGVPAVIPIFLLPQAFGKLC